MQVILRQIFPIGRFHATPWKVNPFDDPYGEWPPSPWRLVRAVVARWYQWQREMDSPAEALEPLLHALCTSSYAFYLPCNAQRGSFLRQYVPTEFGWNPKTASSAAMRSYNRSLTQDNFISLPGDASGIIWWFIQGDFWSESLIPVLEECLARISYFGRAEAFTRFEIEYDPSKAPEPNCRLVPERVAGAVPVLVPEPSATREDIERVTDDPMISNRSVPPGARFLYATRPAGLPLMEARRARQGRRPTNLMQFAIGWNVQPDTRSLVRLTAKFRGAVLKQLLVAKSGDPNISWSKAPVFLREAVAEMAGKDAHGNPLSGHRHAEFFVWMEDGEPSRLIAWRSGRPFDDLEQEAMLVAAGREFSWSADDRLDTWKVRLVPLDRAVPPPPGFDDTRSALWESITPYVPPRHYLRGGKLRQRESIENQIRHELSMRGFESSAEVTVEAVGHPQWVSVHLPHRQRTRTSFTGERRGHWLRLRFPAPVSGPIRLGHSSSFGLGLFRPVFDVPPASTP